MEIPANAKGRHLIVYEGEEYELPPPLVSYLNHLVDEVELLATRVMETQRAVVTVAEALRLRLAPQQPAPGEAKPGGGEA